MNHTTNYQLSQWEAADKVQRADFNADNAKIDAAIKAVDTLARSKADTSVLNALSQTVAGHAAALALRGNCQIWTYTYTGTGTSGHDHPTVIQFPKKPVFAMIINYNTFVFLPPENVTYRMDNRNVGQLVWSGSTASLSHDESDGLTGPGWQLNSKNSTYLVVGFIKADQ